MKCRCRGHIGLLKCDHVPKIDAILSAHDYNHSGRLSSSIYYYVATCRRRQALNSRTCRRVLVIMVGRAAACCLLAFVLLQTEIGKIYSTALKLVCLSLACLCDVRSVAPLRHFQYPLQAVPKHHGRSPAGFAQQDVARDLFWKGLRRQPLGHLHRHAHGAHLWSCPCTCACAIDHSCKAVRPTDEQSFSILSGLHHFSNRRYFPHQSAARTSPLESAIFLCSIHGRCSESELTCSSGRSDCMHMSAFL